MQRVETLHLIDNILTQHNDWKMGDYPMWLWMSIQAPIYHIREKCGVYRYLEESASHSKDAYRMYKFELSVYDILIYFNEKYNLHSRFLRLRRLKYMVKMKYKIAKQRYIRL